MEDVDKKFGELEKLKAGNWVKEENVQPTKLKAKVMSVLKVLTSTKAMSSLGGKYWIFCFIKRRKYHGAKAGNDGETNGSEHIYMTDGIICVFNEEWGVQRSKAKILFGEVLVLHYTYLCYG